MNKRAKPKISKKLQKALDDFPRLIKEQERNHKAREKDIRRFDQLSKHLLKIQSKGKSSEISQVPVHPWRICPYGRHWVRTHELRIPSTKSSATETTVIRHEHCALNPSRKDHLYFDEIQQITASHFDGVRTMPCGVSLGKANGSSFDRMIGGWTQYWNEVLKLADPLSPNIVKALISSESDFREILLANPKIASSARGLMQMTNQSRKILADVNGELKDHFITVTQEDLDIGNINICVGIRWLIHKQQSLAKRLRRSVTWREAVAEYKGLRTVSKPRADVLMARFDSRLALLEKC